MKLIRECLFQRLGFAAVACAMIVSSPLRNSVRAEDAAVSVSAEDAEAKAWDELRDATKPPVRPAAWREKTPSREEQQEFLLNYVETSLAKVGEFLTNHPAGPHAEQARSRQLMLMKNAESLGSSKHTGELVKVVAAKAKDPNTPEGERLQARFDQLRFSAQAVMATNQDAGMKTLGEGLLELHKDYPKNLQLQGQMLGLALTISGELKTNLARALAAAPDASEQLKQKAQDILDGKIFDPTGNLGKPVDIKFTAVDGTEVDLAKMKGKVVLVDFWATWCGPCVAEIPHVKEAYEKYHAKGFEIIGISFEGENGKEKLVKFTKDKEMPWPQYYDGKQWENEFGRRFGIQGIPAMWLFDKKGNLADVEARSDLAGKVAKLLEAK